MSYIDFISHYMIYILINTILFKEKAMKMFDGKLNHIKKGGNSPILIFIF